MAYNALSASVALIESRQLLRVERLSRRRRFVAMSVDVDKDLAVTSFARRGVGCSWHDTHVLARRQGQWVLLGGSGGSGDGDEELLADRPQVLMEWSLAVDRPGWFPPTEDRYWCQVPAAESMTPAVAQIVGRGADGGSATLRCVPARQQSP